MRQIKWNSHMTEAVFCAQKETRSGLTLWRTSRSARWAEQNLSLGLDLVAEDNVGGQPKDDEENAQDNEIYVELCVFHVQ